MWYSMKVFTMSIQDVDDELRDKKIAKFNNLIIKGKDGEMQVKF